jgi:AraC family transcriptional regulator of adaptative response / DNA-3-methyladenine glycosylase II
LTFRRQLDWDAHLAYLAARAIPGVEHVSPGVYRRTVVVAGDAGVLELRRGGDDHLVLVAHLPHWDELTHLVARARGVANLDLDVEQAAADLHGDPLIGPLLVARPGLRTPGAWDPFEIGVRAILGQQVSVAGANTLAGRVVERFGTRVPGLAELGLTHAFPAPERLADADLSSVGLPRARQQAIQAFAGAVVGDAVRLDGSAGLDELVSSLTQIDGVGSWTAHYIALRLGERDAFPASDLGLRRALAAHVHGGPRDLAELAERWRPWRALAATHLWAADAVAEAHVEQAA